MFFNIVMQHFLCYFLFTRGLEHIVATLVHIVQIEQFGWALVNFQIFVLEKREARLLVWLELAEYDVTNGVMNAVRYVLFDGLVIGSLFDHQMDDFIDGLVDFANIRSANFFDCFKKTK